MDTDIIHTTLLYSSKMTFLLCSPLALLQDLGFKVGFSEYSLPEVIFCAWIMESPNLMEKSTEEDGNVACES